MYIDTFMRKRFEARWHICQAAIVLHIFDGRISGLRAIEWFSYRVFDMFTF